MIKNIFLNLLFLIMLQALTSWGTINYYYYVWSSFRSLKVNFEGKWNLAMTICQIPG